MRILVVAALCVLLLACAGCDEMISEILKGDAELTKAAQSGDPQNCKALDTSKDSSRISKCLRDMAGYSKNPDVCELVEQGVYQSECYTKAAVAIGNAEICAKAGAGLEYCVKQVAVARKDRSYCDDITNKDLKNTCLMDVALARGDAQQCRDIPDPYTSHNCLLEYAVKYNEIQFCKETESLRETCVTRIAEREGSAAVCIELADPYDCVYTVASDQHDAARCEVILSPGAREKCVHNIAVDAQDEAVCKEIKNAALKAQCIKSTGLTERQR